MKAKKRRVAELRVAGLFAGIGGIELGLARAGHHTELLCEIDEAACAVLRERFPETNLAHDVRALEHLPRGVDLVTAGFPCQDLSQAGRTVGIKGSRSGLVAEVFRLIERSEPRWLLLENVSFMLALDRGEAMRYLTRKLVDLGYRWAYRVVDSRAFGLPQRRQRVIMLASRVEDPTAVLYPDEAGEPEELDHRGRACGFYWTEGIKGLGWAVDAVPTLKGGSTVGIPSPPAIWMPDGSIVTPDIRDAERMQGFPADWTRPATRGSNKKNTPRWKLVGNAVSVPVAEWVGNRLAEPGAYSGSSDRVLGRGERWPSAAWWDGNAVRVALRSKWPVAARRTPLADFLKYPTVPLSPRATEGFLGRTRTGSLRFPDGFIAAIERHLERMKRLAAAA